MIRFLKSILIPILSNKLMHFLHLKNIRKTTHTENIQLIHQQTKSQSTCLLQREIYQLDHPWYHQRIITSWIRQKNAVLAIDITFVFDKAWWSDIIWVIELFNLTSLQTCSKISNQVWKIDSVNFFGTCNVSKFKMSTRKCPLTPLLWNIF